MESCVCLTEESGSSCSRAVGDAHGRPDSGGEGPGKGQLSSALESEACEESLSCTSSHLGGQQGDQHQGPSNSAGLETMGVCVQLWKNLHLTM